MACYLFYIFFTFKQQENLCLLIYIILVFSIHAPQLSMPTFATTRFVLDSNMFSGLMIFYSIYPGWPLQLKPLHLNGFGIQ